MFCALFPFSDAERHLGIQPPSDRTRFTINWLLESDEKAGEQIGIVAQQRIILQQKIKEKKQKFIKARTSAKT